MPQPVPSSNITQVVELTPQGRGAVAVVLVSGRRATEIVDRSFVAVSRRPLTQVPLGRIALGRWRAGPSPTPTGEELVICRRANDQVEIHCHGGTAAVGAIIERLVHEGCRRTMWRDWVQQTSPDPLRAAAQIALAEAPTARAAAVLLDQLNGALSRVIEVALDAATAGDWQQTAKLLDDLLAHADVGLHLTSPWRVVFAGPPNVGKSSLFNALAGFQRAIVSHIPGTTRDVVTLATAIDGWPVVLADTAGMRTADDALEAAGVAAASAAVANADLVLEVYDASAEKGDWSIFADDSGSRRENRSQRKWTRPLFLRVANKIDLLPAMPASGAGQLLTGALTGAGIAELVTAIGTALVPAPPTPNAAVPFTREQIAALSATRDGIEQDESQTAITALKSLLAS